jgi:colanic acid/amylovoran biosynthesis protein
MKIVIVNAYLRNNGDAALLSVLIEQLKQVWPAAQLTISSLEDPADYSIFDGCINIGSMRLYSAAPQAFKLRRILHKVLVLLVELWWPYLGKRLRRRATAMLPALLGNELKALDEADLVVSTGGGYLNGVKSLGGNLNVKYVLLPLKLAEKLRKPVMLAPQSFGPFGSDYQRAAVKKTLNGASCILVRERKSYDLLCSLGVNQKLLVQAVDSGFGFDTHLSGQSLGQKSGPSLKIGITARLWFSEVQQQAYMQALARFIATVQKDRQVEVCLIPQVTSDFEADDDDRVVERKIAAMARSHGATVEQIDKRLDPHEIKALYNELDFTIGTRFHSVIFSLTSYVPAIAIEYEHKTSGIMQDLGLEKWVIKIEDVTSEKLIALYDQLMLERPKYIQRLRTVLPPYIEKAQQTGEIIKQAYERSPNDAANAGNQKSSK